MQFLLQNLGGSRWLLEQHLSLGCPCQRRGPSQIPGRKSPGMELGEPRKVSTVPKLHVQRRYHRRKAGSSLWPSASAECPVQEGISHRFRALWAIISSTDFFIPLSQIISALHPPTPTAQAAEQNPFMRPSALEFQPFHNLGKSLDTRLLVQAHFTSAAHWRRVTIIHS